MKCPICRFEHQGRYVIEPVFLEQKIGEEISKVKIELTPPFVRGGDSLCAECAKDAFRKVLEKDEEGGGK